MNQHAPYAVQVELTEGCNLRCDFCGLQSIRTAKNHDYKYMTMKTATTLAEAMYMEGWNPRIEFAMHGEPTLNPMFLSIVGLFREWLPDAPLMMTSNGGGIIKDVPTNANRLFDVGLNCLALDLYDAYALGERIRKQVDEDPLGGYDRYDYPTDRKGSPHQRWPVGSRALVLVQDIAEATKGNHATLNNHCGGGAPLNTSQQGKRCAKPFREMSVRWDGRVALCCNTWEGRYSLGDVTSDSLVDIWDGQAATVARKHLYHGLRTFRPCLGCDARSYRVGLLPDPLGKESLELPSGGEKLWAQQHGVAVMTPAVVEPEWEDLLG